MSDREPYLTTKQAAAYCSVTTKTIGRWVTSGRLRAGRTHPGKNGRMRFRRADLDRLINGEVVGVNVS